MADALSLFEDDTSGATFSPCGRYRYRLWRVWDRKLPVLLVCMLNPSVAGGPKAHADGTDATIKRVIGFARSHEFGGIVVVNLLALVETDSVTMLAHPDPVGAGNDSHIEELAAQHRIALCAWGTKGSHLGRDARVIEILKANGCEAMCLRTTSMGFPEHPLCLPKSLQMKPWDLGVSYEEDFYG